MTRSFARMLVAACAGAFALAASAPTFAQASITITSSGCTTWVLGGTPGAQTLTCTSGAPATPVPVCTVQGPATGVVGVATTLTARCVPEANSFVWTGGSCAGQTGAKCNATSGAIGIVTYTVRGTNTTGPGPVSPNFAVNWLAAPPPMPTGCSITRAPTNGQLTSAGGAISVTGSCTGTVTAWNWQKNGATWGTTAAAQGDTLPSNSLTTAVNYTYTLTACNGTSCAASTATTFTVAAAAGGGGGGTGPISCTGVPGITRTVTIDLPWVVNTGYAGSYASYLFPPGMTPGTAVVGRFTVPAGSPNSTDIGRVSFFEFYGTTYLRFASLSNVACDWTDAGTVYASTVGVPSGIFRFWVGGTHFDGYPILVPGQTYYVNVKTTDAFGNNLCSSSACDIAFDLSKAPGTPTGP